MSTPAHRRSRKRLATRRAVSVAATRLFLARGFDPVTIDKIAAADVGRMTVFNHVRRQEDMLFDRDEAATPLAATRVMAQAPRIFRQARDATAASAHVLAVIDGGARGLHATPAGASRACTDRRST